jgi:hypothetical protein
MHPSSHVRPAASREPYRASSRSKCSSRAPSPTTAWKPRAGSFVYLELHADAIVYDDPAIRPERKAELLEDLGEMNEEADEDVERCRAELGLPKPTA